MNMPNQVGAFFDLDGTLLPSPSLEWRLVAQLLARGEITSARAVSWLGHWCEEFWRGPESAVRKNKRYLAGLPESLASNWLTSQQAGSLDLFPEGLSRIAWHLAQGHQVFIVSGTLAPLARALAQAISARVAIVATELEVSNDSWTGKLAGDHMSGEAKRAAIHTLAEQRRLRLGFSYAYGNETGDLPMLERVGHPCAVNPGVRLRRIAAKRDWLIFNWTKQKKSRAECVQRPTARESR